MTHATFTFNTTRSVRFGSGVLAEIGGAALALGGPRALLVTDRGMVATGIVARALAYLAAAGVEVVLYDAVAADPPEPKRTERVVLNVKVACVMPSPARPR